MNWKEVMQINSKIYKGRAWGLDLDKIETVLRFNRILARISHQEFEKGCHFMA